MPLCNWFLVWLSPSASYSAERLRASISAEELNGNCSCTPDSKGSLDLRATLASALIFVGGFCVIITLWYLGTWRTDVPGFWQLYRSPTIGDGILLPLSAGLLIGAGNKLPPVRREVFVMTLTGGLGLAIGTLLQLIWWSDPHPLLNWTIPAPHKFSAPGIYHAIFLAAASAFFAAVIGRLLWRVRLNRRVDAGRVQTIIESPAAALLIACVLGFAVLVALDGYYVRGFAITNTITSVSATFMILIAVAVVALLMLWALGRDVIDAWRPFVWGCCLATAIGIATWDEYDTAHLFELPQVLVVTLVGTTICLLLWKLHSPFWWMQAITACLILLGGLSRSFALASSSLYLTLLGACAVVITIGIMIGILKQKQVPQIHAWHYVPRTSVGVFCLDVIGIACNNKRTFNCAFTVSLLANSHIS